VRRGDGPWLHVEVSRPDISQLRKQTMALAIDLCGVVRLIDKPITIEVVLRREPNVGDSAALKASILRFCKNEAARQDLASGLGFLLRTNPPPVEVAAALSADEEQPPYVVAMGSASEGKPERKVIVRVPFLDERAANVLREEARQLPKHSPGLIMLDVTEIPTVFQNWKPLVERRFQPKLNTRIGGVCLFVSGLFLQVPELPDALPPMRRLTRSRLFLPNPHADMEIPLWVQKILATRYDDPIAVGHH